MATGAVITPDEAQKIADIGKLTFAPAARNRLHCNQIGRTVSQRQAGEIRSRVGPLLTLSAHLPTAILQNTPLGSAVICPYKCCGVRNRGVKPGLAFCQAADCSQPFTVVEKKER